MKANSLSINLFLILLYFIGINFGFSQITSIEPVQTYHHGKDYQYHLGFCTMDFTHNGRYIVSAGMNGAILWETNTGEKVRVYDIGTDVLLQTHSISTITISPDDKYLFTAFWGNVLRDPYDRRNIATSVIWNLETGDIDLEFKGHLVYPTRDNYALFAYIFESAISNDSKYILTSGVDYKVELRDLQDGSLLYVFPDWSRNVEFSPNNFTIIIGTSLYDFITKEKIKDLSLPNDRVDDLVFSPDGQSVFFVGASTTSVITQLDWNTSEIVNIFGESALTIDISPDGKMLMTSWPGKMDFWDVNTGKRIKTLKDERFRLPYKFHPDGTKVLTDGPDGTALLWNLDDLLSASNVEYYEDFK